MFFVDTFKPIEPSINAMSSIGAAVLTIVVVLVTVGVVVAIVLYLKKEAALKNATMQYNATTKTWTGSFKVVDGTGANGLFLANINFVQNIPTFTTGSPTAPATSPAIAWKTNTTVVPGDLIYLDPGKTNYVGTVPSAFSTITITTTSVPTVTPATGTIVFT